MLYSSDYFLPYKYNQMFKNCYENESLLLIRNILIDEKKNIFAH